VNWDVFWSVLVVVFIIIPLFFIWGFAIVDLFARRDLGGFAKVLWLMFILFLPLLGTLLYYLFRPAMLATYDTTWGDTRTMQMEDRLNQLQALKDKGMITEDEFTAQRQRVLAM
jgi:membrane protein implicated in regulation of membrane protease activity